MQRLTPKSSKQIRGDCRDFKTIGILNKQSPRQNPSSRRLEQITAYLINFTGQHERPVHYPLQVLLEYHLMLY